MDRMMNRVAVLSFLMLFLGLSSGSRDVWGAQSPEEFFRGKTIVWIFSGDAGSPGDLISRTIAPYLEKEIGARVRVENKRTDEGVNYTYTHGSKEGLTLCTKTSDAIIGNDILNAPGVQYETEKFNFVADVYPAIKVFQASPKLAYKTLDDLRKAKGLRAGATSAKGSLALSAAVSIEILGLDGKVITGFKGKKNLTLALARGEVDFMVTSDNAAKRDEADGYIVNRFTMGSKRSVAVPEVPSIFELGVKIPKELSAPHKFITSGGTAVILPPGVPQDRVEYLRKSFMKLSDNKDLQKALGKLTGDSRPFVPGSELQEEMTEMKSDANLASKLDAIFKKHTAVR